MQRKRIGVIDILGKSASKRIFSRYSRANNMSIMPQVIAVWAEQLGHEVHFACYSGPELFIGDLPDGYGTVVGERHRLWARSSHRRVRGADVSERSRVTAPPSGK